MTENLRPIDQQPRRGRNLTGPAFILGTAILGGAWLLSNGGGKVEMQTANGATSTPSNPASQEIKATPTPSEAAAGSASPSPEARGDQYSKEGHYDMGEFATVKKGDYVISDAAMAVFGTPHTAEGLKQFVPAYDQDGRTEPGVTDTGKTGTMIHFDQDAEVYFPYAGDVIDGSQIKNEDIWVSFQTDSIIAGGCKHGCTEGVGINNKPIEWKGLDTMLTGGITAQQFLDTKTSELTLVDGASPSASPDASHQPENCTCVVCCPATPAPTPTCATPAPSQAPEATCTFQDKIMDKGTKITKTVYGFTAEGDDWISINGGPLKRYYDSIDYKITKAVERKWFGVPTEVTVWSKEGGTDFKGWYTNCEGAKDDWVKQVALDIQDTLKTTQRIDAQSLK